MRVGRRICSLCKTATIQNLLLKCLISNFTFYNAMGEGDTGRPAGIHGVQVDSQGRGLSAGTRGGRRPLGTQVK